MASSSISKPILYSCIAHHTTILTECTVSAASNASSLASVVLPKITTRPDKKTLTHGEYYIHYIASGPAEFPQAPSAGGLSYVVVANAELERRVAFGYLLTIQKRFLAQYPVESTDFSALPAFGAGAFNHQMKKLIIEHGSTEEGQRDAIREAQREIEGVRNIMTENIERVLERGERIDLLVDKTDRLGGNARDFRVRSRGLRRKMWWKNVKLMVLLAVVVMFLMYLFVGFGCGLPAWSKCVGR